MDRVRRALLFGALPAGAIGFYGFQRVGEDRPLLKLGITTDVHHSTSNSGTRKSLDAMRLLRSAIARFNDKAVDLVVDLGDLIQEVDEATDAVLFQQLFDEFETLGMAHQHTPGNHDIRNIGIEGMEAVFGAGSFTSRSIDLNGFHLVFFCPIRSTAPFTLTTDELTWLENDLAGTELPTIIFTHVPINAGSLDGNSYFAEGGGGEWTNASDAAALIEVSTTILVLQGHTHWNAYHVEDDIHYITFPSMAESRRTPPNASGASALVEITDQHISVKVNGRDSIQYKLRRRVGSEVWT